MTAVRQPTPTPEPAVPGSDHGAAAGWLEGHTLAASALDEVLRRALDEDRGAGDLTTRSAVPAGARAVARLVAKERGTLSGLAVFACVFTLCDAAAAIQLAARDGDVVQPGAELARIEGEAHALLLAERTALNLLQRMSGVATQTAAFVERAAGRAQILDTRKTTPNLRALEKYAVLCGGGLNHRIGLYDEVLLKENHFELAGLSVEETVAKARADYGPKMHIVAEARTRAEALAALRGGANVVLLDNMAPSEMTRVGADLRALAADLRTSVAIEASGGISAETLDAVLDAGVDRISIGALTHSVKALDFSLYLEPCA